MSLLTGPRPYGRPRRRPRREVRAHSPTDSLGELIRRRQGGPSDAGVPVDAKTASAHGAVFACVDLIARMLSTLPVHEYRRVRDGPLQKLDDPRLLDQPDGELEFQGWSYALIDSWLKRGNLFGLIEAVGSDGFPTQVSTVHPDDVSFKRRGRRGPIDWKVDGTEVRKWPAGELWHVPAYTVAGSPIGLSPIGFAALTIGTGLAAQRFGAKWFRDGAVPTSLLVNEAEVNKPMAELAKERWMDALDSNREPVVMGNGWQHHLIAVNAEESQFLNTIHANMSDVCRFFGVLPEEIGSATPGASITYANIEQRQIHLLVRTIGPWMIRLEKALSRLRPGPRVIKFTAEGLLRVDTSTRHKAYEMAIRNGWLSVNEVRALEDRPSIGEAGDRYLWPPLRQQLSQLEVEEGADNDPEPGMSLVGEQNSARALSLNGAGG